MPMLSNILKKTWIRLKDFVYLAFPLIVAGSVVLGLLQSFNLLGIINRPFEPVITGWLMLPAITGITLIYGILRKELALEMLLVLAGVTSLTGFMTPLQIFTFTLVVTLYFPCIGTFAALKHEFGWKDSSIIAAFTIIIALLISGLVARILLFAGVLA